MTSSNDASGRKPRGMVRSVLILGLLVLVGLVLEAGGRIIDAPWSLRFGRPTPEGDWYAPVKLAEGATGWVVMSLEYQNNEEGILADTNLVGTGRTCVGGQEAAVGVSGALDRSGRVERFGFADDTDPVWILYPDGGQWDAGGPTLTITTRYSYDPARQHISTSGEIEPTVELVFRPATAEEMSAVCE